MRRTLEGGGAGLTEDRGRADGKLKIKSASDSEAECVLGERHFVVGGQWTSDRQVRRWKTRRVGLEESEGRKACREEEGGKGKRRRKEAGSMDS